ncbi:putative disease resistance protein RGA1 [Arachis stenosperma]|uniref:putative disease resistance protein RGA1 n=1 Tax=Arachis stenosperma TaxID=217475 RepID=UPI0025ACAD14|nr:putative disease resistance protein RGA1 [Arachis stenosperma]
MAEPVPFGIMERLIADLASPALDEIRLKGGFSDEMNQLKDTLVLVKSVLLDAERKQENNRPLTVWLRELKNVLCDADDFLDDIQTQAIRNHVDRACKVRQFFTTSNSTVFRVKMARKMKSLKKRLDMVAADMSKFALEAIDVDNHVSHRSRETTSPVVADVNVIGREIDKEFIIDLLMQHNPEDDDERIPVIPIVGTGGLGKTTLAHLVFRDERITQSLPLKLWVSVSLDFDIQQLIVKIINSASPHLRQLNLKELDMEPLIRLLKDTLAGQKFLLVLDNVWNEDRVKWMELKFLIEMSNKGGKILLTTRSSKVASMMGTVPAYKLQPLSEGNSMFLFLECASRNREEKKDPDLVMIGKEIVGKCKGLPLAIRTLGSLLLSNRTKHEWESLRTNDIWNSESILPALKLSYGQMPTYLKQCFALFSLYPKGYIFLSFDVACLWGALGLLLLPSQGKTLLDVSNQYLSELSSRSFIQVVEDCGTFFYFQIHDLVHDLALLVARNECVLVSSDMQNISGNILHQSYIEDDLRGILFTQGIFRVRTILSPVHGVGAKDEVLLNAWISRYKSLRFLDLSDSTYETLPQSIAKLKHLRFLSLRNNTKIQRLPASICKLLNLQSLLLDGCTKLEILPKEWRNLINLRQLGITTKQSVLPESEIAKLSSLEYLCIKKCDKLVSLFVGRKLPNLRTLEVDSCERLKSLPLNVNHFPQLETLVINKCGDLEFSEEVQNSTLRLKVLYLHSLPQLVETLPSCFQGSASTLEALAIKECNRLESLPEWLSTPSSLKSLQITNCPNLKSLPGDLHRPALKSFQISDCPRLQEM